MDKSKDSDLVAERLRTARKRAGLTLEQVAEKLQVTSMTISRYERGIIKTQSKETLLKLAKLYGVSPAWLLGDDVPMLKMEMPKDISQEEVIRLFSQLTPENQKIFLALLKSHLANK